MSLILSKIGRCQKILLSPALFLTLNAAALTDRRSTEPGNAWDPGRRNEQKNEAIDHRQRKNALRCCVTPIFVAIGTRRDVDNRQCAAVRTWQIGLDLPVRPRKEKISKQTVWWWMRLALERRAVRSASRVLFEASMVWHLGWYYALTSPWVRTLRVVPWAASLS